jgi:hypothetical protein
MAVPPNHIMRLADLIRRRSDVQAVISAVK